MFWKLKSKQKLRAKVTKIKDKKSVDLRVILLVQNISIPGVPESTKYEIFMNNE